MTETNNTSQSSKNQAGKLAPTLFISSAFREQFLAPLKGAPLSVYLAYKSFADKSGVAYPSLRTLAKVTDYGINAVKRARRTLIEMGLLSPIEQSRDAGQFGRKKFRVNTVAPKQAHGTVAPSTVAPKQCQEGFPSEGFPSKGGDDADAVRRPVDAERRINTPLLLEGGGSPLPKPTPVRKKEKLEARLAAAIRKNKSEFYGDLDEDEKAAFRFLGYSERQLTQPWVRRLSGGFIDAIRTVYLDHEGDNTLTRGNFSSKVIDYCMSKQRAAKKPGMDPSDYFWPHGFQEQRDELRAKERQQEAKDRAKSA